MKRIGHGLLACFCLVLVGLSGDGIATARAEADAAAWLYEPTSVAAIDLTLPSASIAALETDPTGEYQRGTFSLAVTDGTPTGIGSFSAPIEVGIRLKGGLGSLRTLDEKAAFKVKVDEFVKGQTFLGLRKLTLNNLVQDPSMVHEVLSYGVFRALGVSAPRTGYAYLRVNGEDFGLHLNVETLDKVALEKRFGAFQEPPQHLYEGEYGADVTPGAASEFEVDEGKKKERIDLDALVAAVDGGAAGWRARVEPHADLVEMAWMWAVEKYVGHWDGYAGDVGPSRPNNFYLYSDAAGRFQMFPWGTDQTWDEHLAFDGAGGALFNDCLDYSETCAGLYRDAAVTTLQRIPALDLDTAARCTTALLRPWQEIEMSADRHPFSAAEIAEGVRRTREFIAARPGELASWLDVETPLAPAGGHPCPFAGSGSPTGIAAVSPAVPALRLGRVVASHGVLVAHVQAPAAGTVSLRATTGRRRDRRLVCDGRARTAQPATLVARCRLADSVRARLHRGRARVAVRVDFSSDAGSVESLHRFVGLPRDRPPTAQRRSPK
jgi:hypothetical protein